MRQHFTAPWQLEFRRGYRGWCVADVKDANGYHIASEIGHTWEQAQERALLKARDLAPAGYEESAA